VTQWQVNDNLDWIRGKQEFRFGINTRRVDVSDFDLGDGSVSTAVYNDLAEFTYGAAIRRAGRFPFPSTSAWPSAISTSMQWIPINPGQSDVHRRNADHMEYQPANRQNLFARPAGSFIDLSHNVNQPLDQAIQTGVSTLFPSTPLLVWQPACLSPTRLDRQQCFISASASSTTSFPPRLPISPPRTLPTHPPCRRHRRQVAALPSHRRPNSAAGAASR